MSTDEDLATIAMINRAASLNLTFTGRAAQGTLGGAIFVDLDDGGRGVVTRFLGPLAHARQTADVVNHARSCGLPVPRHHRVIAVGGDIFIVQERLPGEPPTMITPAVIDALVEINDRFAHLLAHRSDVPTLPLCLDRSGDPFPRHEVLAEHSGRSRRILNAIKDIGRRHPGELAGDDLLHIDLDLSNILFSADGKITGVVDWNLGAYRGDRHLGLVKTRFEQEWALQGAAPDPVHIAAARHLDDILSERVAPVDLQRYWAHRLLYQLHWVLQCAPTDVVDWHLSVAEDRLFQRTPE